MKENKKDPNRKTNEEGQDTQRQTNNPQGGQKQNEPQGGQKQPNRPTDVDEQDEDMDQRRPA